MLVTQYIPLYFEPIEHPRAEEARRIGMTVEQLLALEKAQAESLKNQGVIIKDHKDAYLNQLATIRNNPLELQRQKEGEAKAKENAARAFNGVLAMGMPSTYYNLFNMDNLLSDKKALVLDLGSGLLLGGMGIATGRRALQKSILQSAKRNYADLFTNGPVRTYGKVKYYGPTMGKTTASNSTLIDFDDVVRPKIKQLAKSKGIYPKDLKIASDPDYVLLINDEVVNWQLNPASEGKTLMISNKALSNPSKILFAYDNTPSIPSRDVFIRRLTGRGAGTEAEAADYYDALLKENPNLQLDNRFVSQIENGSVLPTTSKLTEAEKLGIPKGTKIYSPEENLAFRQQINDFANKYGYEPIGTEVTDPEVLERYARSLIKRHNTYFRGVNGYTSEAEAKLWATHAPGGGAGELYISPYKNVASMYGDPVEIMRPFKLGKDRTKWFTEGDFKIATAGGLRDMQNFRNVKGIVDPWNTNEDIPIRFIPNELTGRNQQFIPQRITYVPKYGSKDWGVAYGDIIGSKNRPTVQFTPNIQFKSGGKINNITMNYLDFFKKGGGIHIKKKNRGKFTDYCGGTVTEECIQRGKHSSNPTTRKRATFAANARKWKHQTGGELINPKKGTFFSRTKVETPEQKKYTIYLPEDNTSDTYQRESTSSNSTSYDLSGYIFPEIKEAIVRDSKPKAFADKAEFITSLSRAYKSAGFNDNLVKLLVAQDALESGWGKSVVGDHNYGNIKKGSSWKGKTKSAVDDNPDGSPSEFRSYNDFREYVADKINLLTKAYDITANDTVEQAIAKLNGQNIGKRKYATSPTYAKSLMQVYKSII